MISKFHLRLHDFKNYLSETLINKIINVKNLLNCNIGVVPVEEVVSDKGEREDVWSRCLFCRKRAVFQVVSAKLLETSWCRLTHLGPPTTFRYAQRVHRHCAPRCSCSCSCSCNCNCNCTTSPGAMTGRARDYPRLQPFYLLVQLAATRNSELWDVEFSGL